MLRPLGAPAADGTLLVRPLLVFSREETGHICSEQGLPVWEDSSNQDPRFERNRIRAEVMPVLEALHPGAARRISGLASRLEEEASEEEELIALALGGLGVTPESPGLARRRLIGLRHANRRRLLRHWLEAQGVPIPTARLLEQLSDRLAKPGSGEQIGRAHV